VPVSGPDGIFDLQRLGSNRVNNLLDFVEGLPLGLTEFRSLGEVFQAAIQECRSSVGMEGRRPNRSRRKDATSLSCRTTSASMVMRCKSSILARRCRLAALMGIVGRPCTGVATPAGGTIPSDCVTSNHLSSDTDVQDG
jgi:hypothetical protein